MGEQRSPLRRPDEVLELLIRGYAPEEIARELSLSGYTVRNYLVDLRNRYGAHSRAKLIAIVLGERLATALAERDACRRDLAALDRRGRTRPEEPT